MKTDSYGEVINSPETYREIATKLQNSQSVVIGWTDENMTHFDILFTLRPVQAGTLQGGVIGPTDLFISIMRIGAFAYDLSPEDTHPEYFNETLGNLGASTEKVAELINSVRSLLR